MFLFQPNVDKLVAKRNVKALIKALRYTAPYVRRTAAEALGKLGDAKASEAAASYWISDEKWGKAIALGAPAVGPLSQVLADESQPYKRRQAAAQALRKIGGPQVVAPLIKVLAH